MALQSEAASCNQKPTLPFASSAEMWLTYGLLIIIPMAANRTFPAMTTGRLGAPMGGLRSANPGLPLGGNDGVSALATIAAALSLGLKLSLGCRT